MQINLKSYRKPFIKVLSVSPVGFAGLIIFMGLSYCFNFFGMREAPFIEVLHSFLFYIGVWLISLIPMLLTIFWKRKYFVFNENEIIEYKRGKQRRKINVNDIEGIHYYKFRFRYLITIFAGALDEGGCWKLHIWLNDGTKTELCFFSMKDVEMLRDKLYPDLVIFS